MEHGLSILSKLPNLRTLLVDLGGSISDLRGPAGSDVIADLETAICSGISRQPQAADPGVGCSGGSNAGGIYCQW